MRICSAFKKGGKSSLQLTVHFHTHPPQNTLNALDTYTENKVLLK